MGGRAAAHGADPQIIVGDADAGGAVASQFAPGLHFCGARPCSTRDGRLCVAHSTRFVWVWHRPAYVLGNRTLRTDGVRVLARRPHGQGLVPAIRVSVYPVSTLRLRVMYVRTYVRTYRTDRNDMHGNEPGTACLPSTDEVRVSPCIIGSYFQLPAPGGIKDAVPGGGSYFQLPTAVTTR
jgi:hypothetical protein